MSDITSYGEISKVDTDRRQVSGWAYVTHAADGELNIDKSGDFIDDIEELEQSAYDFVLNSRMGGVDHRRTDDGEAPIVKSTLVESMVFTPDKCDRLGIPRGTVPYGWWVTYQIQDDETWDRVKKGELKAFSIHGRGTRSKVES